jgi:hypothetical protein
MKINTLLRQYLAQLLLGCFRQTFYRNKHTFYVQLLFLSYRAVYEIMWKNTLEPGRPEMTITHMRFACWIPQAINTLSEYIILIDFPLQQWLHERTSMFRYSTLYLLFTPPSFTIISLPFTYRHTHSLFSTLKAKNNPT